MSELSQAEQYLLDQIRTGKTEAWSQLVERYQGRLLAFAQSKLGQRADAEDLIQDTFMAFLKGWMNFRGQASLETYLFTILRRKIINVYRNRRSREICLLQDVYQSRQGDFEDSDPFQLIAGDDPTASWYVKRDEQNEKQREVLTEALRELVSKYKESLNFRDLKIIELIFYCHLSNKDVANITKVTDKNIAVIKHRCLKQVHDNVSKCNFNRDMNSPDFEYMLQDIWESQRLSCPKRNTIGAYMLKTLDDPWQDYVEFHINEMGCHFCRANLDDLLEKENQSESKVLRQRIMESTVGFLNKT